jgi:hypothetical protein
MKVFVVTCGAYAPEVEVIGVYSTRGLAEQGQDKANEKLRAERSYDSQTAQYASIDEYELDSD